MTSNVNREYLIKLNEIGNLQQSSFKKIKKQPQIKDPSKLDYFDTTLSQIDTNQEGMFLTENIYKKLQDILHSPEEFKKLSKREQAGIQSKLNQLNYKEYEWKSHKKFTHDSKLASSLNSNSCNKFCSFLEEYKNPPLNSKLSQRSYTHFFHHKLKTFLKGFASIMIQRKFLVFNKIRDFSDEDISIVMNEYLLNKWIFSEIVKLAYKKAHDNIFNKHVRASQFYHSPVPDNVLTLMRHELMYYFSDVFALQIINSAFNYTLKGQKSPELSDDDIITIERESNRVIKTKLFNFKKSNDFWGVHVDNVKIILSMVESSGFYKLITSETKRIYPVRNFKSNIKYILFEIPKNDNTPVTEFPKICRPEPLKTSDIDYIIKPIIFGYGSVSKSKKLCNTLNICQSKKFRINTCILKLMEGFLAQEANSIFTKLGNSEDVKLPFPSSKQLVISRMELDTLQSIKVLGTPQKFAMESLRKGFLGEAMIDFSFNLLSVCTNASKLERYIYSSSQKANSESFSQEMRQRHARTILKLAEVFVGFPIFITDKLCARLRLYPNQPLISRTSGDYKYLLCDYSPIKVSEKGLQRMLEFYYEADLKLKSKYFAFLQENRTISGLNTFFQSNPLTFSKVKKIIYFSALHISINKAFALKKTDFSLEIDQNSSGVTFLSLLLRNKKLAQVSGLIPKDDGSVNTEGPYDYCLNNFKEFYELSFDNRNARVLEFLTTNRKLHKYAMMCFCYSQTHTGRMSDFFEAFREFYGETPNEEEGLVLSEFAVKYVNFQDFLFPGLENQMNLFKKVVELAAKEKDEVSVRTFEGEVLTWTFYASTSQTRTTIDPFTKKAKKYKLRRLLKKKVPRSAQDLNETVEKKSRNNIQIDLRTFRKNFIVYLIHSIDAAMMRYFIRTMYEKYKCRINHLHDCVLIHPNYVDDFYKEVSNIYSSDKLYYLAEDLVFDQIRANLSTDLQIELDILKEKYHSMSEDFKDLIKIEPHVLYSPES